MYKKLTGMGCDALFKYIQHIAGLTSDNTVERNMLDHVSASPNTQVTQKKKSQFSQQESNQ